MLRWVLVGSDRQGLHLGIQVGLAFEADARQVGQRDEAVLDLDAVWETAERLKQIGVALVATQAEAGREKAAARRALADAKQDRDKTKVTKRAQQQRLAKAQERLATCETAQETPAAPAEA